ncbi:MAG: hypothetical protein A2Y62_21915 [Candidatus Fischerbacteria bacterium RBG_13_37_8]|uniref:Homoserine dehydrogenase n=1 Tax=Candidatus Fischerbacteria bacterium RBG_13_37_8 TaxID=1817863 RepID=A0A1F5VU52_9BACT|nr:MAG: hypothetical protein A2Y62_21915 [Candidatus Fischerbacteria bacterium RBG_13_37_8]
MKSSMIQVGVLGCGKVGSSVIKCWQDCLSLKQSYHIGKVLVHDVTKCRPVSMEGLQILDNIADIIDDPAIEIIIDTIGQEDEAFPIIRSALLKGKSIVCCNHSLLLKYGTILENLAKQNNVNIRFSAALGIARKIITEDNSLDNIVKAAGIFDEVSGFLLNDVEHNNYNIENAIQKTIAQGISVSTITKSINGDYSAGKLALLISLITKKRVNINSIHKMKIENIDHLDFEFASLLGYSIKHVAYFENKGNYFRAYVEPVFISSNKILASIKLYDTGIFIMRERTGENYYIERIVPEQVAYRICQDVVNISQGIKAESLFFSEEMIEFKEEHKFQSHYYIRIKTLDNQNAITDIMMICKENDVLIKDMGIEKAEMPNHLDVFLMTHPTEKQNASKTIKILQRSDLVKDVCKIRILDL